jgi:adenosylmethionine-8-amino-7-oxononanoate aminotransferase
LENGQRILDGCAGAAVAVIGHGSKIVADAMVEQSRKVSYVHTLAYTTSAAEELADLLLEGNTFGFSKAYFVGSGSEATDSAIKLARQYFFEKRPDAADKVCIAPASLSRQYCRCHEPEFKYGTTHTVRKRNHAARSELC